MEMENGGLYLHGERREKEGRVINNEKNKWGDEK